MDGFWAEMLTAVIAAGAGAGVTLLTTHRPDPAPRADDQSEDVIALAPPVPELVLENDSPCAQRCRQAVCRAGRAADSVSSVAARQALGAVVRRMDAELPHVEMLVELARRIDGSARQAEIDRVSRQLEDVSARFAMVADQLVDAVRELVADADLSRLQRHVAVLREEFPLLRPMSAVLPPQAETPPLVAA